jgi:hypothetical protein
VLREDELVLERRDVKKRINESSTLHIYFMYMTSIKKTTRVNIVILTLDNQEDDCYANLDSIHPLSYDE